MGVSLGLILVGVVLLVCSGVAGLLPLRPGLRGDRITTIVAVVGAGVGFIGAACGFGSPSSFSAAWAIPIGRFSVGLDAVSAAFLLPVFLIPALGSIYGQRYWSQAAHPDNAWRLRLFYGLLAGAMALVLVSRDGVLFLIAWELMALAAYFLVTTEDQNAAACRAGWIYLVATHLATLCLMAMFAIMQRLTGSFEFAAIPSGLAGPITRTAIFFLAIVGFGLKAGIMPLHVWLPAAHANAPSHVSAVMSGVMIKMGIYGIVRVSGLLPNPPVFWGATILALGVISGVLGVAFAIGQHDIKRLLAYHSIENIGIILLGIGLALIGRSLGRADWMALGLGGALLHVWNHGLFKSLLFLSAGSVIHATGTREIDRMGGLAAELPRTAMYFLIGAVAICGLPPLNGFVSELLIYVGLLRTVGIGEGPSWMGAAFAVPALALIGALAVACFVKVYGAVFLGMRRTDAGTGSHEAPSAMTGPMGVLAGCCVAIGLVPSLFAPILNRPVAAWAQSAGPAAVPPRIGELVPLGWVTASALLLIIAAGAGYVFLRGRMRREAFGTVGTWDCGYAAPSHRMQYTASSFAEMLVGLFSPVLRPRVHHPRIRDIFPAESQFESHVEDTVLDGAVLPALGLLERVAVWFRFLQQGRIQLYILYVLIALVGLLLWIVPMRALLHRVFSG